MDLTKISNHDLLNRVDKLARTERKITHLILWHLVEVDSRRLYLDLGYPSLFRYMTSYLHYSEDAAYRRIQAAKLLKKVPQLEKSLESGELNLTQLQQVQKCLNKELGRGGKVSAVDTGKILEQIQNKSSFETQKILAVEFNQPIEIHEKLKPQQDNSVRVELTLTEEQWAELQQAKELLSHVLPNEDLATLISYLTKREIKKRMGKENQISKPDKVESTCDANKPNSLRKSIKITTRRILLKRARHHCEFNHPTTGRCQSKHFLQIDHVTPLALGGSNDITNLRVLCRAHNLAEARRMGLTRH